MKDASLASQQASWHQDANAEYTENAIIKIFANTVKQFFNGNINRKREYSRYTTRLLLVDKRTRGVLDVDLAPMKI